MSQREQVKITLPPEVTRRLDERRGDASRSTFVEGLIMGIDPGGQLAHRRRGRPPGVPGTAGKQPAASVPSSSPSATETSVGIEVLAQRNRLLYADADDVVQKAVALTLFAGADRNQMPPVFFYRSSLGQSPEDAVIENFQEPEAAWAYNDRF